MGTLSKAIGSVTAKAKEVMSFPRGNDKSISSSASSNTSGTLSDSSWVEGPCVSGTLSDIDVEEKVIDEKIEKLAEAIERCNGKIMDLVADINHQQHATCGVLSSDLNEKLSKILPVCGSSLKINFCERQNRIVIVEESAAHCLTPDQVLHQEAGSAGAKRAAAIFECDDYGRDMVICDVEGATEDLTMSKQRRPFWKRNKKLNKTAQLSAFNQKEVQSERARQVLQMRLEYFEIALESRKAAFDYLQKKMMGKY